MKSPLAFLTLVILISPAVAEKGDREFFCEAEATAGIGTNGGDKWTGAAFDSSSSKFVLKLAYVDNSIRTTWDKKLESITEYKVLVRPKDSERAFSCGQDSAPANTILGPDETFVCAFSPFEIKFNLQSRRYLQIFWGSFLDGDSSTNKSPYIQAGRCTRID